MNRQKLLLSTLLALLVIVIAFSYWRMPRQKTVTKLTFAPGAKAKQSIPPGQNRPEDKKVRLDLLNHTAVHFSGFRKNIFQPLFKENKLAGGMGPAKPARLPLPGPASTPQPTPVQRDLARFTFLGFLKKENRETIFLSGNNEIFLAKKGDTIAGNYLIVNITDEMLVIRSLADGGETVIPLSENRPLQIAGQ